jgi:mannosyl-glycoprotein endo-beta-N-acetylglucosaminidase
MVSRSQKCAFLEWARPLAQQVQQNWGVPWQNVVAQAAVETTYGTSPLARQAKNYFGIHGQGSAGSMVCERYRTQCRAYNTPTESFDDYGRFLNENALYSGAMAYRDDPYRFVTHVWLSGYAEATGYAEQVSRSLREIDPTLPPPNAELRRLWHQADSTGHWTIHGDHIVDPRQVLAMRSLIASVPTIGTGTRATAATAIATMDSSKLTGISVAALVTVALGYYAWRAYRS